MHVQPNRAKGSRKPGILHPCIQFPNSVSAHSSLSANHSLWYFIQHNGPPHTIQDPTGLASAFIIHSVKSSASSSFPSFPSFPSLRRAVVLAILDHGASESERTRRAVRLRRDLMLVDSALAAVGGNL